MCIIKSLIQEQFINGTIKQVAERAKDTMVEDLNLDYHSRTANFHQYYGLFLSQSKRRLCNYINRLRTSLRHSIEFLELKNRVRDVALKFHHRIIDASPASAAASTLTRLD